MVKQKISANKFLFVMRRHFSQLFFY